MSTGNAWTIEQGAYEFIRQTQPSLIMTITGLLLRGQTPAQIINFISARDVFWAGIVECAIPVIQEKISNSIKGLPFGGDDQVKP
jgi:hypothetical protein